MQKPYKYTIFCHKTNKVVKETNIEPLLHELQTYEPVIFSTTKVLTQTKTVYVDTRYEAKLRLYNYVTFTRQGLEVPSYKPFEGTQIGKTVPILNF